MEGKVNSRLADTDDGNGLVIAEVTWEEKSGNGWLLREVFDLVFRDPDLTDDDTPLTMPLGIVVNEEGGNR